MCVMASSDGMHVTWQGRLGDGSLVCAAAYGNVCAMLLVHGSVCCWWFSRVWRRVCVCAGMAVCCVVVCVLVWHCVV